MQDGTKDESNLPDCRWAFLEIRGAPPASVREICDKGCARGHRDRNPGVRRSCLREGHSPSCTSRLRFSPFFLFVPASSLPAASPLARSTKLKLSAYTDILFLRTLYRNFPSNFEFRSLLRRLVIVSLIEMTKASVVVMRVQIILILFIDGSYGYRVTLFSRRGLFFSFLLIR